MRASCGVGFSRRLSCRSVAEVNLRTSAGAQVVLRFKTLDESKLWVAAMRTNNKILDAELILSVSPNVLLCSFFLAISISSPSLSLFPIITISSAHHYFFFP